MVKSRRVTLENLAGRVLNLVRRHQDFDTIETTLNTLIHQWNAKHPTCKITLRDVALSCNERSLRNLIEQDNLTQVRALFMVCGGPNNFDDKQVWPYGFFSEPVSLSDFASKCVHAPNTLALLTQMGKEMFNINDDI